jgi:hypothetical protein
MSSFRVQKYGVSVRNPNILFVFSEIYNTFANHKPYDQDNESDYFSSFDDDTLGSAGSGWTSLGTLSQRGNDG